MSKSYVSIKSNITTRLRELYNLYHYQNELAELRAAEVIQSLNPVKEWIEERLGCPLKNKKILEIGPGQMLKQYYFFGHDNAVIGVDTDVIIDGFDLLAYFKMIRINGMTRAIKTIGRKFLGVDARFKRTLLKNLGVTKQLSPAQVITADIAKLNLPDNSFDCAISFSVFEHIAEPETALHQISRLLKPGGVAYICVHPFTSENGHHDPRFFNNRPESIPYWAHLRPKYQHLISPNCYLNKISMAQWKLLFSNVWTGCEFKQFGMDDSMSIDHLRRIRAEGDLADYTDEELLIKAFAAIWVKPTSALNS